MNTKICLIKENVLAYKGSDYAVLSAGTPVRLINAIKDESGENVAVIEDCDGVSYKLLETDLIPLSSEDIKTLRDKTNVEQTTRSMKIAKKIKPILMWSAGVTSVPVILLRLFNITNAFLNTLFPTIFVVATVVPAIIFAKYLKEGKYAISESYFLNFSENKKKLESFLKKEEEEEEYAMFEEEMSIEREKEEE
jgi:hypothetical protein